MLRRPKRHTIISIQLLNCKFFVDHMKILFYFHISFIWGIYMEILAKIKNRDAVVGIVGLGYVGLPLAICFAEEGFRVIGFDISMDKCQKINKGEPCLLDIPHELLSKVVNSGKMTATTSFDSISKTDCVIICVPTPLNKTRDPDVSFIMNALESIVPYMHKGHLLVLESTTYPGFTREVLVPFVENAGFRVGIDCFIAFSPERIDPGNKKWGIKNTPKVIGGYTKTCAQVASALYGSVIEHIHCVSSTDAAEMSKLLENTFRAVNIALVNEIAMMCHKLGVNTWEVVDAAATKPFGFVPFRPGPGFGGHCIPIDPLYLSWKLKSLHYHARFIELADAINSEMPRFVTELVLRAFNKKERCVKGAKILILGVAYKKDIEDVRESPAFEVMFNLEELGAIIRYHDPFCPYITYRETKMQSVPLEEGLRWCDCALIITDHSNVNYQTVLDIAPIVVDTRNATKGLVNKDNLFLL